MRCTYAGSDACGPHYHKRFKNRLLMLGLKINNKLDVVFVHGKRHCIVHTSLHTLYSSC